MKYALAFDLFGTLVKTNAIRQTLEDYVDDQTGLFYNLWRNKQLEYSFRKTLMNFPADFSLCTKEALDYCCTAFDIYLSGRDKKNLLKQFSSLPSHQDVREALETAKTEGHKLYILSNGNRDVITDLLHHNQLYSFFHEIISAQDLNAFKPVPAIYEYFVQKSGRPKEQCWLISANSFDIIGAAQSGLKTMWIQRSSENIFDPWDIQPSSVIGTMAELTEELNSYDEDQD